MSEEPKKKKYDTLTLSEQFEKPVRRAKRIGIVLAVLTVAGIAWALLVYEGPPSHPSAGEMLAKKPKPAEEPASAPVAGAASAPASAPVVTPPPPPPPEEKPVPAKKEKASKAKKKKKKK